MPKKEVKVVELFAGVGGFRLGLENSSKRFKTIWANQWEPGKKHQYAFDCYVEHFGASPSHVNEDIAVAKNAVPKHDLLVGGFPCQDYSVARTGAKGIEGQKGVLWWEINDILIANRPPFVVLENVDRLIKSPRAQRGRDLAIILRCFYDLGYAVEWRVINAADYGNAQRRRRTFLVAYHETTTFYKKLDAIAKAEGTNGLINWLIKTGFFAPAFPVTDERIPSKGTAVKIDKSTYPSLADVSSKFDTSFYNAGIMYGGQILSEELTPKFIKPITLREIRLPTEVDEKYYLNGSLEKWTFLKGPKKINRTRPNGEPYQFSEGGLCFPDDLDKPSRTMLTSESTVNRSTHVIEDAVNGRKRLLTPVECERLNGFPDGWTDTGMPERSRYFMMGNALVVPVVTTIADRLKMLL